MASDEDLQELDRKVKQLKLDYERYFLGTRPREPIVARREIQRFVAVRNMKPRGFRISASVAFMLMKQRSIVSWTRSSASQTVRVIRRQ